METQLMYFYVYNAKKKRYDLANYNGVMADIGIKIKDVRFRYGNISLSVNVQNRALVTRHLRLFKSVSSL